MTEKERKTGRLVLLLLAALAVALGGFWFSREDGPSCSVVRVVSEEGAPAGSLESGLPSQRA